MVEGKTFGCILAPGQVKSLECRLEVSAVQATEAKRVAANELDGRVLAHERDRVGLETAISAAEEGEGFSVRNHASGHVICCLNVHLAEPRLHLEPALAPVLFGFRAPGWLAVGEEYSQTPRKW